MVLSVVANRLKTLSLVACLGWEVLAALCALSAGLRQLSVQRLSADLRVHQTLVEAVLDWFQNLYRPLLPVHSLLGALVLARQLAGSAGYLWAQSCVPAQYVCFLIGLFDWSFEQQACPVAWQSGAESADHLWVQRESVQLLQIESFARAEFRPVMVSQVVPFLPWQSIVEPAAEVAAAHGEGGHR